MSWQAFLKANKGKGKNMTVLAKEYRSRISKDRKSSVDHYTFSDRFPKESSFVFSKPFPSESSYVFSKRYSGELKSSKTTFKGVDLSRAPDGVVYELMKQMDAKTLIRFCNVDKRIAKLCSSQMGRKIKESKATVIFSYEGYEYKVVYLNASQIKVELPKRVGRTRILNIKDMVNFMVRTDSEGNIRNRDDEELVANIKVDNPIKNYKYQGARMYLYKKLKLREMTKQEMIILDSIIARMAALGPISGRISGEKFEQDYPDKDALPLHYYSDFAWIYAPDRYIKLQIPDWY